MTEQMKPDDSGTAGTAQSTKEKVQDTAQQVQQQVGEKTQEVKGQATDRVRTELDSRSTQAGEQITATAGALRKMSTQLKGEDQATPAKIADQAATHVDRLGRYLTETNADRMLHDVERFARKQPWIAVAGGVVAGFMASRFVKASSSRRYEQSGSNGHGEMPSQSMPQLNTEGRDEQSSR
jgi:hypothetical protein